MENSEKISCSKCGAIADKEAAEGSSGVDVVGSVVLGGVVVGLFFLFGSVFGIGGGRFSLVFLVGLPLLIIFALGKMVGSKKPGCVRCNTCGYTESLN
jgi:hypothetical protein